jgi:hypothetical protein
MAGRKHLIKTIPATSAKGPAAERPITRPKTAFQPSQAPNYNYGPPYWKGGYVQHYGPPPFFPVPPGVPPHRRHQSAISQRRSRELHPGDRFNSDEKGSPKERKRDTPRAPPVSRSDLSDDEPQKWVDEFNTLFSMIRGFCVQYFHHLPPVEGDLKSRIQEQANGYLWGYICNIAANGQEGSRGEYALRLLNSPSARAYFFQRLVFQYVFTAMMSAQAWADYSTDLGEKLRTIELELQSLDGEFNTHNRMTPFLLPVSLTS